MRFEDDRAQSVLVGAVLLFAILIVAFSTYQAFVVPSQNAEVELNHNGDIQTDIQELRNSLLDVRSVERINDDPPEHAVVSEHRATNVRLGTRFPPRLIAMNPPPASGTLRTAEPASDVRIENAEVKNPDNFDVDPEELDVLFDPHETKFLVYQPNYNEFQNPPNTVLEHSLLYNGFSDEDLIIREQNVVNTSRNRIQIVLFDGDVSRSGTRSVTLDPQTLDGPTAPVVIEPEDGENITLRLPTDSLGLWEDAIGGLPEDEVVINDQESSENEVVIDLLGEEYDLRMTRVGFDGGSSSDQFTPIQYDIDTGTGEGNERLGGPRVFSASADPNEGLEEGDEFELTASITNVGNGDKRGGTPIQRVEWYFERDGPQEGTELYTRSAEDLTEYFVSIDETITVDEEFDTGENELRIRAQDSRGIWSEEEETDSVTVVVEEQEEPEQEFLFVEAFLERVNLEGEPSDIEGDPTADTDSWLIAEDDGTDTELRGTFEDPSSELDGEQTFEVKVRRTDNSDREPTVDIELWEDGEGIDTLATEDIESTDGELITVTWDPGEVTDGSDVEIRIFGYQTGGQPGTRNTVEIGAVRWDAQLDASG